MNYHLFLDESGDHGLSFVDPNFPLFILSACLFSNIELEKLEEKINNGKFDGYGLKVFP